MDTPPNSTRRPISRVFVEIPPSPLHAANSIVGQRPNQLEAPFKMMPINVNNHPTSSGSAPLKRKSSDAHNNEGPQSKKPKIPPKQDTVPKMHSSELTGVEKDQVNDAKARCHQCTKNIDTAALALCTYKRPSGKRCPCRYCNACLKNRYQLDITSIKSCSTQELSPGERAKHVLGTDYVFQCPRCGGGCNCKACRRAQGLPALGLVARKAIKQGVDLEPSADLSQPANVVKHGAKAKDKTSNKPKAKVGLKQKASTNKLVPHVLIPPSPYKSSSAILRKPSIVKVTPPPPPEPLPKPVWTQLLTPLTLDGAVERMHIREFLLRFAHLTEIGRTHLEDLEELATYDPFINGVGEGDGEEDPTVPKLVGWISDAALRAIIVGLLTLISKDIQSNEEATDDSGDVNAFGAAIQKVRKSGSNLSPIWAALDTLRTTSSLFIPDPLPPPTRGLRGSSRLFPNKNTGVLSTAQFVPVINALVDAALATEMVREDFERAATQEKELGRAARELTSKENTRFRVEKSDKTSIDRVEMRARRTAHDATLALIDGAYQLALAECGARFGPLGRDFDGRIYYAISPGVVEREAAVDILEGGKGKMRFRKKRAVAEHEVRKQMRSWSWFVAVWGRKPEGAILTPNSEKETRGEMDSVDSEDQDTERWWGFWEPEEIAKLAEWLSMRYNIDLDKKRVSKDDNNVTLPHFGDVYKKPRGGRPSNASSAAGSSTRGRVRTFASLNDSTDDEDDYDEDVDTEEDVLICLDSRGEPVSTKHDLCMLVRRLKEYSELLAWRIKRASKGEDKGDKDEIEVQENGKGKNKTIAKPSEGIAPVTFYGKN